MSIQFRGDLDPNGRRRQALSDRHRKISARIGDEEKRPLPDAATLQRLKRERLRLKDELKAREGVWRTLNRLQPTN